MISNFILWYVSIDKFDIILNGLSFDVFMYFINIKVVNYVGLEIIGIFDVVMVDIIFLYLDFVCCFDLFDFMDVLFFY